jgi:hypothetical protein
LNRGQIAEWHQRADVDGSTPHPLDLVSLSVSGDRSVDLEYEIRGAQQSGGIALDRDAELPV